MYSDPDGAASLRDHLSIANDNRVASVSHWDSNHWDSKRWSGQASKHSRALLRHLIYRYQGHNRPSLPRRNSLTVRSIIRSKLLLIKASPRTPRLKMRTVGVACKFNSMREERSNSKTGKFHLYSLCMLAKLIGPTSPVCASDRASVLASESSITIVKDPPADSTSVAMRLSSGKCSRQTGQLFHPT
jgi:hypothetical protein